jgi:hypothetical protein
MRAWHRSAQTVRDEESCRVLFCVKRYLSGSFRNETSRISGSSLWCLGWRRRRTTSTVWSGTPSIRAVGIRAISACPTPWRRWRNLTSRPAGHPGRERRPVTVVVAGDKNRDTDEDQGGDQTTPPPSILPRQLLLDSIKTSVDFVPLISSGACFFRHKLRPPTLTLKDQLTVRGRLTSANR